MLIVAIESRFGITFEQRELLTFKNVGDMHECLAKKLRIG
jgi:acyl carrier protein